ncbi:AraC family transcriptional regulator [Paenibacillus sp. 2TAB23]|uniref:AraC family transcriptional regulator n=1 Tax=Paenibacillus sp. 2TAB23 TaxID=3233004 RepID=UPI003F9A65AD
MIEEIKMRQDNITTLITRHCKHSGVVQTTIPSLFLIRSDKVNVTAYRVFNPSFCFVTQGLKEIFLAEERLEYGPSHYLITSMKLPVIGQVIKASPDEPYLSLKLNLSQNEVLYPILPPYIRKRSFIGSFKGNMAHPLLKSPWKEATPIASGRRLTKSLNNMINH